MATEFTASTSSGYMTNVQFPAIGNKLLMLAHFSAPAAVNVNSSYIRTYMQVLDFYEIDGADVTTLRQTTESGVFGKVLYFSGVVAGGTGNIFILGQ